MVCDFISLLFFVHTHFTQELKTKNIFLNGNVTDFSMSIFNDFSMHLNLLQNFQYFANCYCFIYIRKRIQAKLMHILMVVYNRVKLMVKIVLTFISKGESAHLWETFKFFKANRSRAIDSHNSYLILFDKSWARFRFFASFLIY